jgi:hypothetical protein
VPSTRQVSAVVNRIVVVSAGLQAAQSTSGGGYASRMNGLLLAADP